MVTEPASDLLQTVYRPDLGIFVGRWGYQPAVEALPAAYAQITREALASKCPFWLQDIRRRSLNDPATTKWLLAEYFPQMAERLGGHLAVAYLASPMLRDMIVNAPGFAPPESYRDRPFVLSFFTDEGAAIGWLHEQQRL